MTQEQLAYVRARYPTTTALVIARELGVAEGTVYKYTRLMGLKKNQEVKHRMLSEYGKMGGKASAKQSRKDAKERAKTEAGHNLLVENADTLDTLASMLCGFGRYDYYPDKKGRAIPIEAVRELLRIGATFNPLPIEAIREYLRMGHEFQKRKRKK
jgi:hypothetical protein